MENHWFKDWFNSEYYHLLYDYRDVSEAERFIQNLVDYLPINEGQKIIDIGCGQGRHAITLSKMGFKVTGIDLSKKNIQFAKKQCRYSTKFDVCDMRLPYKKAFFDVALNLFTSFGYFENRADDLQSLNAMCDCLKPSGILLLDYFNAVKLESELTSVEKTEKSYKGINFQTIKYIKEGFVIKDIFVKDKKGESVFKEKVKLIDLKLFKELLNETGFEIIEVFGDYEMNAYDEKNSERLIIAARKK